MGIGGWRNKEIVSRRKDKQKVYCPLFSFVILVNLVLSSPYEGFYSLRETALFVVW